nr:PREDICTED: tetraspanin-8-like [Lepisosteus oculatus]
MLNGYQDWGQKVPDSCRCPPFYQYKDCVSVPVSPKNKWGMMKYLDVSGSSVLVYKQPCGPIVLSYMRKVFDISLGITFGLAISAFIGMVMSMTMYCQIKRPSIIFSLEQSPPKYTELYSTAEY